MIDITVTTIAQDELGNYTMIYDIPGSKEALVDAKCKKLGLVRSLTYWKGTTVMLPEDLKRSFSCDEWLADSPQEA